MANFINPVPGARVTSEFGYRVINGNKEFHQGIDIAKSGTVPILASASGTVRIAQSMGTYGNVVIIKHVINGKRQDTTYAHLKSFNVKVGQVVKQGQVIGVMGNTGRSYGQHLHFEVHEGAWATGQPNARNPRNYVNFGDGKGSTVTTPSKPNTAKPKTFTSIVDYLDSLGAASSFADRVKLANKLGIPNYTGTAEQNTILLAKAIEANTPKTPQTLYRVITGTMKTKSGIEGVEKVIRKKYPNMVMNKLQYTNGLWYIQTGTFTTKAQAEAVAKTIKGLGYLANVEAAK